MLVVAFGIGEECHVYLHYLLIYAQKLLYNCKRNHSLKMRSLIRHPQFTQEKVFYTGWSHCEYLLVMNNFSKITYLKYDCVIPFGVFAILSDIIIAATLVVLLRRNRSEFEDTNSLIKRLIVYAVNRCVLTSYVGLVSYALSAYSIAIIQICRYHWSHSCEWKRW